MKTLGTIILILLVVSCGTLGTNRIRYHKVKHTNTETRLNQSHLSFQEIPIIVKNISESNQLERKTIELNDEKVQIEDTCDIINFRDGSTVTAKVLEISDEIIKYRRCTSADGPLYILELSKIESIEYPNGVIERFVLSKSTKSEPTTKAQSEKVKTKKPSSITDPDRDRTNDSQKGTLFIVLGVILLILCFVLLWQASLVTLGCAGEIVTLMGYGVGGVLAGAGGIVLMVFGILLLSLKARYSGK